MTRTVGGVEIGILTLDTQSRLPLYKQLYVRLRDLILERSLRVGVRLPSNRTLAAELGVSRNTVVRAVRSLVAEGYLSTRAGGGTYVDSREPKVSVPPLVPLAAASEAPKGSAGLAGSDLERDTLDAPPFELDLPALDAFPVARWRSHWLRRSRQIERTDLGVCGVLGEPRLRQALADHLALTRGLRCRSEQVIVVASSLDAVDTVIRVLVNPGDVVWVEEPGDLRARAAFFSSGARVVPVPIDAEGLDPTEAPGLGSPVRCVHTTPSHQFPAGITMSLERRKALLEWAARSGAWIIEDDRDSEFRFAGSPLPALQGLDPSSRVIYVGTFAKAMYPSLRLGFMVVPEGLLGTVTAARALMDRQAPSFSQRVLADFIECGDLSAHLRRMRGLYRSRQQRLSASLEAASGGALRPREDAMGTHSVVDLPDGATEGGLLEASRRHRLGAQALSRHYVGVEKRYGVLLGYGHLTQREMHWSVRALLTGWNNPSVHGCENRVLVASRRATAFGRDDAFASRAG